jgi:indolepyruvate ferredoxin oxidoreductase
VEPLETAFGRKRRINQSSCNKDFSCLEGFCPSFVTITGATKRRRDVTALLTAPLPAPPRAALDQPHNTLVSGIGGLGVTTLAGILSMAAHLEGLGVRTLNQPGLAQKGGGVTSHIRIAATQDELLTPSVPFGEADLHLGYDMIGAGRAAMRERMSAERTATLVNSDVHPTSKFLSNTDITYDREGLLADIRSASRDVELVNASRLAETIMGTELFGNMVMLGYALQKGWLPLSLESLTQAIVLNGASAAQNRQALDLGRLAAIDPARIAAFIGDADKPLSPPPSENLNTMIADRAEYLRAYQSKRYARRYQDVVADVREAEAAAMPGSTALTEAVARGAFAAMMIKDEYEVARLLTAPAFKQQIADQFEGDYSVAYNLAPSWLAKAQDGAAPKKRTFGSGFAPLLKIAAHLKVLRETPLDICNRDPLRRRERAMRDAYIARMEELAMRVTPANHATLVEIARLPLEMRGYGHVKEAAIAKAEAKLQALLAQMA